MNALSAFCLSDLTRLVFVIVPLYNALQVDSFCLAARGRVPSTFTDEVMQERLTGTSPCHNLW